jgi:pathogen-inducible salicylic acid glucosyltransferase
VSSNKVLCPQVSRSPLNAVYHEYFSFFIFDRSSIERSLERKLWKKMEREIHILVIPYPVQGHINPMLQFSKRLASKGPRVTVITTTSISRSMAAMQESSVVNFETISDGSDEGVNLASIDEELERFKLFVTQSLAELIERQNSSQHPPKFLVYDSVLPWALDVARHLGVDGAPFFTQSCAVNAIYYHAHKGAVGMPAEGPWVSLPSLPSLGLDDMPSFLCDTTSYQALLNLVVNQFSNFQKANWVFFNNFDELEDEVGLLYIHIHMSYI